MLSSTMLTQNNRYLFLFSKAGLFMLLVIVFSFRAIGQVKKDSLERILWNSNRSDTTTVLIHEKLAYHYRFINPDTAFFHARQAFSLSKDLKFQYGLVYSLNHLGAYYQGRGQYNQATSCYNEVLAYYSKDKPVRILKAITLAINNLGMIQYEKGALPAAEYYFSNALKIDKFLNNTKGIARELGNLGKVKLDQENYDSALVYLNQALEYDKAINHTIGMLETMVDIGNLYYKRGNYKRARQLLEEASLLNKDCYLSAKVWIDQLLGRIYTSELEFDKAICYQLQAYRNAQLLKDKKLQVAIAEDLALVYKRKTNYFMAYSFLDSVHVLSVDLQKEKVDRLNEDLLAGFESKKKKEEIAILHANRDKMIYYNSRLISMRNGLILSLCFCLVLGGIIYKAYRDKRNVNKVLMYKFTEIRTKNADIQNKNLEIEEINSSLLATNATLNRKEFQLKEAQRIAGLGSWEYDRVQKKFTSSNSLEYLFFTESGSLQEMNFRSFLRSINPTEWPSVKAALKKSFFSAQPVEVEFSLVNDGQICRYVSARAVPMMNAEGSKFLIAGTVLDNTNNKRAEIKLNEAKSNAELANQSKSLFLANMSHEIRTPLNGILGFTNILLKECKVPQQTEYLKHIRNSGDNLLVLLNDILDFNKIEHGKLEIEAISFQLREMIDDAMVPYVIQAREKGLEIKVHCSPEVPASIIGDPHRTRQLLINYLSNAIKFTKTGFIIIDISLEEISIPDGKDLALKFTVSDSGVGIPAEKQKDIFSAFTQADSSTTRNYGGTGLGLAINSQLTRLMGGSSGVQSPGRLATASAPGADFWFVIKVKRGEYSAWKKKEVDQKQACYFNASKQILVAEDNPINQILMRKVLESMNCIVTMVENGKLALECMEAFTYDAILLDIQMPVMDGHQAAMLIRQSGNAAIPIIGVSANVFKDDIEKSMMAGMDAHLGKPFTAQELFEVLQEKLIANNPKV